MSNTENKGYQLADGSYSSEYKIGDKFVVKRTHAFSEGSVVEFYRDDGTDIPLFKLISGECSYPHADGEAGAYELWKYLTLYVEQSQDPTENTQEDNVECIASGKATIYYTDGTTYTQTNVDCCVNLEDTSEFILVLTSPVTTKLLADVYMESDSIKLHTQHIAGIVFKRGSYEEIYKLKPTFQSTFNVYNSKNVSGENYREGSHSPKYREKKDSQKLSGSNVEFRSKELGISDYRPQIGDYVDRNELTESQVVKFFWDCLQEGMEEGESMEYISSTALPYCGWAKDEIGFYYSGGVTNCTFSRDVTYLYKEDQLGC